ncbi:assimilatory sulfite reductase (NADPH) flavoprotein subunit [Hymenobacter negativus]|uniref:Assimilatory sulfite reductase (NADPH) flavoprotein subunit n=1 Tax=Hymenobacter negativus TaxID=2795026 RepID=A0ABS0QA12_9BACT|nr:MULTISPECIES: assimilatory sulfite reductase (NADPH) flavoprotein subunit [Bacteria]MBH8559516.1 assimilatory sulfite reductase (NADPH) flavoprotein subunit [Hymenobacter negativus]MBH8568448.1 assimilatory sulfite reductase (NADPH) flavoprotein subunit [Hymenobacter negativus]MBR7208183.1 assimilatory sulfite reductase (NADPH) flavoprotein subunit [Microvirga sp. STS02]
MSAFPTLPPHLDEAHLRQLATGLSAQQLVWLSGYFYGQATSGGAAVAAVAAAPAVATPAEKLTIIYGSHTGNGKKVAQQAFEAAKQRGLTAEVRDMNDYPARQLAQEQNLLVVVSTHGEGEPPIAAEELHQFLHGPRAPKLPKLRFAVLALGDSSYLHFCQTGKEFDQRLAELGGTRLLDRVDADVDYQAAATQWIEAALNQLAGTAETAATATAAAAAVTVGATHSAIHTSTHSPITEYTRENLWPARVLESIQLNGRGSDKETYHIELDLAGSGLQYAPGDALAVRSVNHDPLVEEVLRAARLSDSALVQLGAESLPLAAALASRRELTVLTRDVLERYAALAPHAELRGLLADTTRLQPYLYGRDVADLLTDFPTDQLTAQTLADTLRPLPTRAYSIASSLLTHPDEVHLTVGAVRYEAHGRRKQGVCSSFLADRVAVGDEVRVFVEHNEYFKLPANPATDIIMIGAGTGIAPFRAFVEERVELGAAGRNWLLFGNPHFTTDFLYQAEWQQHLKKGGLTKLDVAFSRDQAEKIYVQDRLLENSREVFGWLENGAQLYVCGDKNRLGGAVQTALAQVVQREAGLSAEDAAAYVKNLRKQRRYLEDVY